MTKDKYVEDTKKSHNSPVKKSNNTNGNGQKIRDILSMRIHR